MVEPLDDALRWGSHRAVRGRHRRPPFVAWEHALTEHREVRERDA
jgi:hypothetical protein